MLTPIGDGQYTATDLGTLGGRYIWPSKMNSLGQVVGSSKTTMGTTRAFRWSPWEGLRDLGALNGDQASTAYGINDSGQIVGVSISQMWTPFLWTESGGLHQIGMGMNGDGEDINNQGMVCGSMWQLDPWYTYPYIWTETSGAQLIGTLGGSWSVCRAVNNHGVVVGLSDLPDGGGTHAYLWAGASGMVDLGALPGDWVSSAEDINDGGQIVGWSRSLSADGSSRDRAVLWTQESGIQELTGFGMETEALGINNQGLIAGACTRSDGIGWVAVIWENGVAKDLNTLVTPGLPWPLSYARSINDNGQILAAFDRGLTYGCGSGPPFVQNMTSGLDYCTIQEAIDEAVDQDVIIVQPGTYKENLNLGTKKITLRGVHPENWQVVSDTVVDGDVDDNPATLEGPTLTISGGQGRETVVSGLTIMGGTGTLAHLLRCGGGVYISGSSPTLTSLRIHSNRADYGGGIYCEDAAPLVALNLIAGNQADLAGGGVEFIQSPGAEVTGNRILCNTATASAGGGVDVYDCSGSGPSITNNTIVGNHSPAYAGSGISTERAGTVIQNNIISANGNYGIAVWDTTPVTIVYNDLWNNTNGPCWGVGFCGPTNLDVDPLFSDADGADDDPATWQDNSYALPAVSPCIDAGDNTALPPDTQDLDRDGDTTEPIPFDIHKRPRVKGCAVDMGDFEVQNPAIAPARWDLDQDGDVDEFDETLWESCASGPGVPRDPSSLCQQADLDNDNDVDQSDFGIFHRCLCGETVPVVNRFAINDGAETAVVRTVTLNNACSAGPTVYMASESPDFTGASWQPYSAAPSFTLSAGNGAKIVYFKVRNPAESAVVSDTITLWRSKLDFDGDGDVDAGDRDTFETCASGPGIPHDGAPVCGIADLDLDSDVDQSDFAVFQRCYSGENVPADASCAN